MVNAADGYFQALIRFLVRVFSESTKKKITMVNRATRRRRAMARQETPNSVAKMVRDFGMMEESRKMNTKKGNATASQTTDESSCPGRVCRGANRGETCTWPFAKRYISGTNCARTYCPD